MLPQLAVLFVAAVATTEEPQVNFNDQVSAVFRSRCNSCHNADQKKGGLNLETYSSMMQGGGSGKAVEPGDPDGSWLYQLVSHQEEPKMPPNSPKIPDAELDTIRKWIEAGAPEASGSKVVMTKKKGSEFKLDPSAIGKPTGEPAMPKGLSTEPSVLSDHRNPVIALAASPWAPLIAVGGHKQVLLYNADTYRLAAVFPFPEGTIHNLKFTRDGDLLLVAGGRAANVGRVIVFDVKTGERIFEIGKEYDVVLSADISPDRSMIALGGPSKVLRVYNTADGELLYENKKHTDWVTAVAFSPDGVLLASGDRNGGLLVWEAGTGREFYDLRGHGAMITDLAWRLDSNVLASSSTDTTVRQWDMVNNGGQIRSIGAHGAGAEGVSFAKDGRMATAGRDAAPKLWKVDGNGERTYEGFPDVSLRAVFTHDDAKVVASDYSGLVRVYNAVDGTKLAELASNPLSVAARLEAARSELATTETSATETARAVEPLVAAVNAAGAAQAEAQKALAAAEQELATATAAVPPAEQAAAAKAQAATAAPEALSQAIAADKQAIDGLNAATAAVAQAAEAARAASDAAMANPADASLQTKAAEAEAARVASQQAVVSALGRSVDTGNAAKAARTALVKANTEKAAADQALAAARAALDQANAKLPGVKTAADQANAAKTAADQAIAAPQQAAATAAARLAEVKAYIDSLAAEIQAKAPPAAASTTPPAAPVAG